MGSNLFLCKDLGALLSKEVENRGSTFLSQGCKGIRLGSFHQGQCKCSGKEDLKVRFLLHKEASELHKPLRRKQPKFPILLVLLEM